MSFLEETNIKKGADMKNVLQINRKSKVKKAKALEISVGQKKRGKEEVQT